MPRGKTKPKQNLRSKRVIDALGSDNPRGERYYDRDLKRFGISVYPSGRKVFFIDYGTRQRRRRYTLGDYGPLTHDKAREKAESQLGRIADGMDPLAERDARRAVPTVSEWVDEWLTKARSERKPKTVREYLRQLDHAKTVWGGRPIDQVEPGDVRRAMEGVTTGTQERLVKQIVSKARKVAAAKKEKLTPTQCTSIEKEAREQFSGRGVTAANRWLAAVRSCFGAAVREGVMSSNPAMAIRLNREAPPRNRVLTKDEMSRLVKAVEAEKDPFTKTAVRLLIETGARLSEVLTARWDDIDLDGATWRIPSPKAGFPQVVPLANGTVALLVNLRRCGSIVIAGRTPNKPRYDLKSTWVRICKRAELEGVVIHDLRRSFGLAVARQAGLHVASKLLRHSDVRVTERVYAPLGLDDLRDALEERHKELANVVPFATPKENAS